MYLRVYDSRDSSLQPAPSPSVCYSLTHAHRSIGYRNRNPQPLAESAVRLMYLRVYDSRDSSHQSAPSPSVCYSFTHAHSTLPTPTLLTITCTQVLWFLERLTRRRDHGSRISLKFINLVSIVRCSSSAHNLVHARRVDSSTLVF